MLEALGVTLFEAPARAVPPTPNGLAPIARSTRPSSIRASPNAKSASCRTSTSVDRRAGATAIFGPQKGVAPEFVEPFDTTLGRFATLAEEALGRRAAQNPGAGAAGGLGFAFALLGGTFSPAPRW